MTDPSDALAPTAQRAPRWRVGVGAAVVLLIVGVGTAVVAGLLSGGGEQPVAALTPSAAVSVTPVPVPSTPAASVVVHVLGQVRTAGVYELPSGARVIDAVGAAGGFTRGADPSALNLARILQDGEQVMVPKPGETVPPTAAPNASAPGGASTTGAAIELNSATLEQLETLPRIGPSLGQRILDWREQNGGFASVDDLRNVSGIGDKTFADIRDLVTVR